MFDYQVGILGNAADFYEDGSNSGSMDNMDRRQMMIAFDMRYGLGNFQCELVKYDVWLYNLSHIVLSVLQRCMGFIMAKMVMRELMDPLIFAKFKSFLTKV